MTFIPPFDFHRVFIEPWAESGALHGWILAMGVLVGIACGLVGNYLLLRRMALVGDAISHSVLPGLVIAFMLAHSRNSAVMFAGALAAGLVTVFLIEFIHKRTRGKPDAAICIAFTSLVAIGVVLTSMVDKGGVHIDAECILYGEIAFVPLEPPVELFGHALGPQPVLQMAGVTLGAIAFIVLFYKELLVSSFDLGLAASLGFNVTALHYGLMAVLSIVVVSAFEAVGAVMVMALLALDLGVFHRKSQAVGMKEALIWNGVWIALALVFNMGATCPGNGVASLAKSGQRLPHARLKQSRRGKIR